MKLQHLGQLCVGRSRKRRIGHDNLALEAGLAKVAPRRGLRARGHQLGIDDEGLKRHGKTVEFVIGTDDVAVIIAVILGLIGGKEIERR